MKKIFLFIILFIYFACSNQTKPNLKIIETLHYDLSVGTFWTDVTNNYGKSKVYFVDSDTIIVDKIYKAENPGLLDFKWWRDSFYFNSIDGIEIFPVAWKETTNAIDPTWPYVIYDFSSNYIPTFPDSPRKQLMIERIKYSVRGCYLDRLETDIKKSRITNFQQIKNTKLYIREFDPIEHLTYVLFSYNENLLYSDLLFIYDGKSAWDTKYGYYLPMRYRYNKNETLESLSKKDPQKFEKFLKHHMVHEITFTDEELKTFKPIKPTGLD